MTLLAKPQIQTVFITGIQGLIGWNLVRSLESSVRIFGFTHTAPSSDGEWYESLLRDYQRLPEIIEEIQPDLVIHTQAMCNVDLCELKPDKTRLVNVRIPELLIEALDATRQRLVYVSSEHVFSGKKGGYTEEDTPDPISVYGRSRAEAERLVLERHSGALVIRPGLAIGESRQGTIGPHDWLKRRLLRGQAATLFCDEVRSPIRMSDLTAGVLFLIENHCSGMYHLGGLEKMSRYELALHLAREWGLSEEVQWIQRSEDREMARIRDCSIQSLKAQRLGWVVPSFFPS